jgi:hypothetical protein
MHPERAREGSANQPKTGNGGKDDEVPEEGATVGLIGPSAMRLQSEDRLMFSRRTFLIGLGGLVTSSFLVRARTHVRHAGEPLLLQPSRVEQELYLYSGFDVEEGDDAYKYRASLGPDEWEPPPAPTWREYLGGGSTPRSAAEWDVICCQHDLLLEDLDTPLDEGFWAEHWEHAESPQARAHQLLKNLRLDCDLGAPGRKAGGIAFTDWGGHPGSSERWVDLKDDLTVSILQARITERDLPIRLVLATL